MPDFAFYGAILFTAALVFYSIGIWAEFFVKKLKPWHAVAFFLGVVADTAGTWFMAEHVGGILINTHSIIGILGLLLMILHFGWAVIVLVRCNITRQGAKAERALYSFHKYSVPVWIIWMGAYLSGVFLGIQML